MPFIEIPTCFKPFLFGKLLLTLSIDTCRRGIPILIKVVAKRKDGTLIKGWTGDFLPSKNIFHVHSVSAITEVNVNELKAIFFVKELEGDRNIHDRTGKDYNLTRRTIEKHIRVIFNDGEIIEGLSHSLHIDRQGFFMVPIDASSNNERIFVVLLSVEKIIVDNKVINFSNI